jgi:fumarate hydratase class II
MDYRIERDTLGEVRVPANALYGAQTQRAVENFPVSGRRAHPALIRSTVAIKKAAAKANRDLGRLPVVKAEAIIRAADEVLSGQWHDQFVVDVFQAGAGTSHNMNANEVLARRGELLLAEAGEEVAIHPNDDVNMGQSTNDVMPTAIRLACLELLKDFYPVIHALADALQEKAVEFADLLKSGRTHLQDAVPMRLGQEFGAYAKTVRRCARRLAAGEESLRELGIGGSAVGTGLNAGKDYRELVVRYLREETGFDLRSADDLVEAMQNMDPFLELSGNLRLLAVGLTRIANDIRLLASGPNTGLAELVLPAVQPGSSIMPGKVNPVMAEMLNQACYHVLGNDQAILLGVQAGQLELNVMMPMIGHNALEQLTILNGAVSAFTRKCVRGLRANEERLRYYVDRTLGLATALNPAIGYANAAAIAKEAQETGRSIRELVEEKQLLPPEELERLLSPENMADAWLH